MGSRPSFDFGVFDLPAAGRSTSAIHPPYDLGSLPFFCARAGSPAVQASTMPAMVATIVRTANILASWNSMRYLSRRLFGCFDILHPLRSEFLVLLFSLRWPALGWPIERPPKTGWLISAGPSRGASCLRCISHLRRGRGR